MEVLVFLLKVLVFLLVLLLGVALLAIAFFLWMISTHTHQDSKIFQERYDGWRHSRR